MNGERREAETRYNKSTVSNYIVGNIDKTDKWRHNLNIVPVNLAKQQTVYKCIYVCVYVWLWSGSILKRSEL